MPILLILLLLLLPGCQSNQEKDQSPQPTSQQKLSETQVMQQNITPILFELPSQALQVWRNFKTQKPALVLFSENPFLAPIPQPLKKSVKDLIATGSAEDFTRQASLQRVNPVLLSQQTLSAAIDSQLISEIVWYFPTRSPLAEFKVQNFSKLLVKAGFLSDEEAAQLTRAEEGIFEGRVRGIPLRVVHPLAALPEISQPVLLHIDLGYFRGLFKNSVSTPLYNLLHETALLLRDTQWPTLAVSLSYSNEGGNYALETRFLIKDLAQLLENPQIIDGQMPKNWQNRKEALFSKDFYQESKAQQLMLQSAEQSPLDASVQYDAYRVLIETGQNKEAFEQLDKVVALDPGYAEEYLSLAQTGFEKGWNDQTLQLLDKAIAAMPYNPLIPLHKADLLLEMGKKQAALEIYERQQQLPWSTIYYPEMSNSLKNLIHNLGETENKSAEPKTHQQE